MDDKKLEVVLVQIQNLLGTRWAEFRPGKVTVISGRSDTGKTSVLEAVKAAIGGGRDATLLRHGETEGKVVLVLDNGVEVTKRFTEKGASLSVKAPGAGRLTAAQSFLDELIVKDSFNPVEFLDAGAKKRVEMLLRALPADAKAEVVAKLGGQPGDDVLELIGVAYKRLYDERTGANRMQNENAAAAKRLKDSLPPAAEMDADYEAQLAVSKTWFDTILAEQRDVERLSKEGRDCGVQKATDEFDAAVAEVEAASASLVAGHVEKAKELYKQQAEVNEKRREIVAKMQAEIDALQRQVEAEQQAVAAEEGELRKARGECMAELRRREEAADHQHTENLKMIQVEFDGKRQVAQAKVDVLRAKQQQATMARMQRTQAREFEKKAVEAQEQSLALTKRIDGILELKERLLAKLPVPGLAVVDGEVQVGGVAFDRLSDSQKIEFAVQVAMLCPGRLGLICVDGLEKLDGARFAAFCESVAKRGVQVIGTRVDDGALRVEADGAEVGVVKGGN